MLDGFHDTPLLFIICGPAGSGKTTLCHTLIHELYPRVQRVVTATTRFPRDGEEHGKDYYFLNKAAFQKQLETEGFYEHAEVHGEQYGVLKEEIHNKLNSQSDLVLNIDIQGCQTFRKLAKKDPLLKDRMVFIFVMPESLDQVRTRMVLRAKDSQADINMRMHVAEEEIKHWREFDYVIHSNTREEDFACLISIYAAEKLRVR